MLKIFLCDLLLKINNNNIIINKTNFASFAYDNTPHRTTNTIDEVIQSLGNDSMMLFKWFSDNQMKANISKYQLLANENDEVILSKEIWETKNR